MAAEGACCTDTCCGPGSYCCARANPHTHDEGVQDGGTLIERQHFPDSPPPANGGMAGTRYAPPPAPTEDVAQALRTTASQGVVSG